MVRFVAATMSLIWFGAWWPGGLLAPLVAQATASAATDPGLALIAGTPPGICLILVLFGWLNPKSVTDRLDQSLARTEKQRDDLAVQLAEVIPVLSLVQQTVIPALERSEAAKTRLAEEVRDMADEIRRLSDRVSTRGDGA